MLENQKLLKILAGTFAFLIFAACSDMDRMHDTRMRMQSGEISGARAGTNYGTMSRTGGMMCPAGSDQAACPKRNMARCSMDMNKPECGMMGDMKMMMPKNAIAVLQPASGSNVSGWIKFTQGTDGVIVEADVMGLTPGLHGFHIHEFGDASAADGTSAGGHFNPCEMEHGSPSAEKRHVGDLGNLEADASGHATLRMTDKWLSLCGPKGICGRSVIIHAKADDMATQPTGNAGARVAIGVIGVAKAAQ